MSGILWNSQQRVVTLCLFIGLALPNLGFALDLYPRDGVPLAEGTTTLSLEWKDRNADAMLSPGLSFDVEQQSVNLRLGHAFSLGGMPAYAYAELPFIDYSVSGRVAESFALGPDSGIGDASLALALWPYANVDRGRYWGVAGYVLAPTGEYDVSRTVGLNLNPGSNRYAAVLQTGFHQQLSNRVDWSIAADITVFEDNDDYLNPAAFPQAIPTTLESKPYVTYQTALSYRLNSALTLAASYYLDRDGEMKVAGGNWSNAIDRDRYGLWALINFSEQMRLTVSYQDTVNDDSTVALGSSFQLRFTRLF